MCIYICLCTCLNKYVIIYGHDIYIYIYIYMSIYTHIYEREIGYGLQLHASLCRDVSATHAAACGVPAKPDTDSSLGRARLPGTLPETM